MKCTFFLMTFIFSFSAFAQDNQQARDGRSIGALVKSVSLLSNSDLSCETSNDCQAIAIGARACGGPSSYIVASKNNYNFAEIIYLAAKTQIKQDEYNRNYGINSICSVVLPVYGVCKSNICTTGSSVDM